jgi:hypothetical protein
VPDWKMMAENKALFHRTCSRVSFSNPAVEHFRMGFAAEKDPYKHKLL